MSKRKYIVIQGFSIDELEEKVNHKILEEGFSIEGGVSIMQQFNVDGPVLVFRLFQAMSKPVLSEEEEDNE